MLFSEAAFLFLFLPAVLLLYVAIPAGGRNLLLTLASLVFYALGDLFFTPILLASVLLNYWFAMWIADAKSRRRAFWLLTIGVSSDLGLLLFFKYGGFLSTNWHGLVHWLHPAATVGPAFSMALPLGISFFTFHKISYKVDVYRGHAAAKRRFLDLALYILLFPQLIAGPIVRYNQIAAQLGVAARTLEWQRFVRGTGIFIIG